MTGADATFLAGFFGPGNGMGVERLVKGDAAGEWLRGWLERAEPPDPEPTVLPRVLPDQSVDWYGLAFDDRQFRDLGAHLLAFVGNSFSSFDGRPADLDPNDAVEAAVAQATGGRAYIFRAPDNAADREVLRDRLLVMRNVWGQRPERSFQTVRPTGRVLRDFEIALTAGDAAASQASLDEFRAHGDLSAHNFLFLRIRRLVSLAQWTEVLALDELPTVLAAPRPRLVTQDLIRAVYLAHLARYEANEDAPGALERFSELVLPSYAPLYKSWGGMTAPEALKSFMLAACLPGRVDPSLRDAIQESTAVHDRDRQWLTRLAELAPVARTVTTDKLSAARDALRAERYDEALELLRNAPVGIERSELLIEAALYVETLQAAESAVESVAALSEADRDRLLGSPVHGILHSQLLDRRGPVPQIPDGWVSWLRQLQLLGSRALNVAREAAADWSLEAELAVPSNATTFVDLMTATRPDEDTVMVRDAIPLMLASLETAPKLHLREAYAALAAVLVAAPGLGSPHLAVIHDLLGRCLELGPSDTEYQAIVRDYIDLWNEWGSAFHLDWLLDGIDGLVEHATGDRRGAENLLALASGWAAQNIGRVQLYQLGRLLSLAKQGGLPDLTAQFSALRDDRANDEIDVLQAAQSEMEGSRVGIYTLTERAGRQACAQIEEEFPGVKVDIRSDHVATERLESLARSADVFIIAWQSAKHAATEAIESVRPAHLPLLRATGKGASSLVRALHVHLGLASSPGS